MSNFSALASQPPTNQASRVIQVRDRATRCMLVMELTRGDDDADFVIEGHEAEAAARVETVDEAHERLFGGVEALAVHGPAAMTMNVYAQLQQRAERSHGEAFGALVRRARSGAVPEPGEIVGRA